METATTTSFGNHFHVTSHTKVVCGPIVEASVYVGKPGVNFREQRSRYVLTDILAWVYPDHVTRLFLGARLNADGSFDRRFASLRGGGLNVTPISNPQATGEYRTAEDSWFRSN
jgi:hypothetical protein